MRRIEPARLVTRSQIGRDRSGAVVTTKMTAIEVTLLVALRKLHAGVELTREQWDIKK